MRFPKIIPSAVILAQAMAGGAAPHSTAPSPAGSGQPAPAPSGLEKWWGGPAFTGNWLGLRDALKTHGLTFGGRYDGAFFGVVDSQRGSRGFWDQQLHFNGKLNIGELVGCKLLEAAVVFGEARWRDDRAAANPNTFVQASFLFNPSAWRSGLQWRLSNLGLQISSKNHLPVHDMIVLRGGWLQPQKEFFQQPLATLFLNNALATVGGNIPFSGSFSTWGGTLKCRPAGWFYAKGGLFMAYPEATNFRNHGLAFEGFARNPRENGLMAMAEAGWTPRFGPSALPGKYVAGGYYWGNERPSFNGTRHWGQYGFYWQADQMLFHEPRRCEEEPPAPAQPEPRGAAPRNSGGQSSPFFSSDPTWSEQGLGFFSLITFAPKYNNLYPFYFHAGLSYKGLVPGRDNDRAMFALAYASRSYLSNLARREEELPWQSYTLFLEWDYRIQLTEWAHVQPFVQYVIRPNGTDSVKNAAILGFSTGVTF